MTLINKKGFTLIELLVVIAIIGVLSTLAIIALGSARTKARDSKRMSDLKQIATALELYYGENNTYPVIITPGNSLVSPDGLTTYMNKIPSNPTPRNDGTCPDKDYSYSVDNQITPKSYNISTCLGSSVSTSPPGSVAYSNTGLFSCGQKISDDDGNQYDTVQIGTQCWMKQNLNIGEDISTYLNQGDFIDGIEKYCYGGGPCNDDYGGLYQWHMALGLPKNCDSSNNSPCNISGVIKGICPTGWHIPSLSEFQTLAQNAAPGCDLISTGCSTAGGFLKEVGTIHWWSPNSGATNQSNFTALPSGLRITDGTVYGRGDVNKLWAASPVLNNPSDAWSISLYSGNASAYGGSHLRAIGFSVRCLKDN